MIKKPKNYKKVLSFLIIFLLLFNSFKILIVEEKRVNSSIDYPKNHSSEIFYQNFNKSNSYNFIEKQLDFGYRIPGTEASHDFIKWIRGKFEEYGDVKLYNYSINPKNHATNCSNIIAKVNGGYEEIVAFAAHFDSRAVAEKDSNESLRNLPIMGANDGASGVAILLEIARIISISNITWNNEFWFFLFDAEDQGMNNGIYGIDGWDWCEGSKWQVSDMENNPQKYFLENQGFGSFKSFILLDMVGGNNLKFIKENHSDKELQNSVFESGISLGYEEQFPIDGIGYYITDDHVPFSNLGIPTLDLIIKFWDTDPEGWPYHHTHGDNIAHISKESLDITGKTLLKFVSETYNSDFSSDHNSIQPSIFGYQYNTALLGIGLLGIVFIFKYGKKTKKG